MQKQRKNWKHVKYDKDHPTAPAAERLHLEKVHAGRLSHSGGMQHKDEMMQKGKKAVKTVVVESRLPAFAGTYASIEHQFMLGVGAFRKMYDKALSIENSVW